MSTMTVQILGKEYQVACPESEVEALTRAARFLDQKMAEIRSTGKVVGVDRIAVMAALNIANDYLSGQTALNETQDMFGHRIEQLSSKVDTALTNHKQV
ncbi:MAG: cell division protein ZapA [Pseudomonadota bacterium]